MPSIAFWKFPYNFRGSQSDVWKEGEPKMGSERQKRGGGTRRRRRLSGAHLTFSAVAAAAVSLHFLGLFFLLLNSTDRPRPLPLQERPKPSQPVIAIVKFQTCAPSPTAKDGATSPGTYSQSWKTPLYEQPGRPSSFSSSSAPLAICEYRIPETRRPRVANSLALCFTEAGTERISVFRGKCLACPSTSIQTFCISASPYKSPEGNE